MGNYRRLKSRAAIGFATVILSGGVALVALPERAVVAGQADGTDQDPPEDPGRDFDELSACRCPAGAAPGGDQGHVACCDAPRVPAGLFLTAAGTDQQNTTLVGGPVNAFRLDHDEVSVGRFRRFVTAFGNGWRPDDGDGKNPAIAASGWQSTWNDALPRDRAGLEARLSCATPDLATWTTEPSGNESRPVTCLDWTTAFAFCAWDRGWLPLASQWEYAAQGGDERRTWPWGDDVPTPARATFGGIFSTGLGVGSPTGTARWGQRAMAGGAFEWTLDCYASTDPPLNGRNPGRVSCAAGFLRAVRGGSYQSDPDQLRTFARQLLTPDVLLPTVGVRCGRGK